MIDEERDAAFDELVGRAVAAVPSPFAEHLGSVAIVVEDEPSAEQLTQLGVRGLFGLYQGVPRTRWGADAAPVPSKITIYQGPLERHYRDPEARAAAVEDTVFHEIAHHFGIDDGRLRQLQRARPGGRRRQSRASSDTQASRIRRSEVKVDIQAGWGVYTNDGEHVGEVGEVGTDYMVVRSGLFGRHELFVPTNAVAMVGDDRVQLNMNRSEIDAESWGRPPSRPL